MKNKVQDLGKVVSELSGSVGDVLQTQAKALRENKEDNAKFARQLHDLNELSTPRTKNDTSAVPKKPATNPRDDAKSSNQKEDERKRKSGPVSPEKKQGGRGAFESCQRTRSWPDESYKKHQPWAEESDVATLGNEKVKKTSDSGDLSETIRQPESNWSTVAKKKGKPALPKPNVQSPITNEKKNSWENCLVQKK